MLGLFLHNYLKVSHEMKLLCFAIASKKVRLQGLAEQPDPGTIKAVMTQPTCPPHYYLMLQILPIGGENDR
jgi:hypothetical protein